MTPSAQRLFELLYGGATEGFIEIRALTPERKPSQQWFSVQQLPRAAQHAIALRESHDVYFGVALRTSQAGGKDAISAVPALWADIDSSAALAELIAFPLPPSAVVRSGSPGGHHGYWFLVDPVDIAMAEDLLDRLAARLGSDPRVTDASRILRVPGTLNHKHELLGEVDIADLGARRYSVEELESHLAVANDLVEETRPKSETGAQVATVLEKLDAVRPSGRGWLARCPAHDDENPSLKVDQGDDGRCLVHCHAGCGFDEVVSALGLETADLMPDRQGRRRSQQSKLMSLIDDGDVELFHDPFERAYALLPVDGHIECWQVGSEGFDKWLGSQFYRAFSEALKRETLAETTALLNAMAKFDGEQRPVHHRVGGDLDRLVIDLGNDAWQVVVVSSDGQIDVVDRSPVPFVRDPGYLALPDPEFGGTLDELRQVTSFADDEAFALARGGLLAMFHPFGPYFVTYLQGPAGSGKTMNARTLASLVDPHRPQFMNGTPRTDDLMVAAANGWLVGLDNVSRITRDTSDVLCALSTGGGSRKRALYTNADAHVLEVKRPVMFTSIGRVVTRADLVDRLAPIVHERVPDDRRRTEQDLATALKRARPRIFGAVLEALAGALRHLPDVQLDTPPRMADVTRFVTAAEGGIGGEVGEFHRALLAAQGNALREAVEASPFTEAVVTFMQTTSRWEGTMSQLLKELERKGLGSSRRWPTTPSTAGKELDENELPLAQDNIAFTRERTAGGNRERIIVLERRDAGHTGTDAT